MKHKLLLFFIIILVGLSQLSETIYIPSLTIIAKDLNTSAHFVEWTLSIYLLGLAIGSFIFGVLSDKYGRKPIIIVGLLIYILGCFLCYSSKSIYILIAARFIQSFGVSVGMILGQSMARDTFRGEESGKIFSIISSALGLFPAVGPIIGQFISNNYPWQIIFISLFFFGIIMLASIIFKLQETNLNKKDTISIMPVFKKMLKDPKVLSYGIIIGVINGTWFSYLAESPFYLINLLQMPKEYFGYIVMFIAIIFIIGGIISKKLHKNFSSKEILTQWIKNSVAILTTFFFITFAFNSLNAANSYYIISTIIFVSLMAFSNCIIMSCSFALALREYQGDLGTAGALLNLFFYTLVSLATFIMGAIHNSNLLTMPFYFLCLSLIAFTANRKIDKMQKLQQSI